MYLLQRCIKQKVVTYYVLGPTRVNKSMGYHSILQAMLNWGDVCPRLISPSQKKNTAFMVKTFDLAYSWPLRLNLIESWKTAFLFFWIQNLRWFMNWIPRLRLRVFSILWAGLFVSAAIAPCITGASLQYKSVNNVIHKSRFFSWL